MKPNSTLKKLIHGGMTVVMFTNTVQSVLAQQGVTIGNGGDVVEGVLSDPACLTPSASTCTIISIDKGMLSGILAPVPPQSSTVSIGGAGVLVNTGNVGTSQLHVCGTFTSLGMSLNTTIQIVASGASKTIYICDFDITPNNGSATNINFVIGTGTNCASGSASLGPTWYMAANQGKISANAIYRGFNSAAVGSAALCVQSSATSVFGVALYYDQY